MNTKTRPNTVSPANPVVVNAFFAIYLAGELFSNNIPYSSALDFKRCHPSAEIKFQGFVKGVAA